MKKFLFLPLVLAFLFGCAQKGDIENLQKQIDDLKSGEIASINSQISGIQTSLQQLGSVDTELRQLIGDVKETYQEVDQILSDLTTADETLGQRISDLKSYCEQQDNGVRDWVSLTFTTLEQHSAVLGEIAIIKSLLVELDGAISSLDSSLSQKITDAEGRVMSAIEESESSIKGWVNEQLDGYYPIAQVDAKLKLLEDAYKDGDLSIAQDIEDLRGELETMRTNLTLAYKQAISDAITENNGNINQKIATDIENATNAIQAQLTPINQRLDNLETRVSTLESSLEKLIGMVQSIVVVPDYSDGSVKMTNATANVIRFEVYPLAAAEKIVETGVSAFSLDYVETVTKSSALITIPISAVSFDGEFISITADGSALSEAIKNGMMSANARLRISDGTVTRSSEYFLLTYSDIPLLGYSAPGAYLTNQKRSYVAGTDQYCIEYDGTNLTFILLNPAQNEQVVISGYDTASHAAGDAVTVSVNWQKAGSSIVITSLSTTILKIDGEQVWMGTSDGQGVIIRTE